VCTGFGGVSSLDLAVRLSVAVDGFVFDGGVHSEARVAALPVVEDLKVLEDGVREFDAGLPSFSVQQFDLHPGPERFDHRVVEAITDRSHRREQPGLLSTSGEGP